MAIAPQIPDFATHYYRTSRRPFLNLSDLDGPELVDVVTALAEETGSGHQHRPFGRTYIKMRRRCEALLRDAFAELGGQPERQHPHYFVLGESAWFRGLAEDMAEVRIALTDLPPDQTTVTWCDSFGAMRVSEEFGLTYRPAPHHGRVFRLADVPDLAEVYGLPGGPAGNYEGLRTGEVEASFVEIQLWSDEPVREWLAKPEFPRADGQARDTVREQTDDR